MLKPHAEHGPRGRKRELLGPFEDGNGRDAEHVLQAERLEILKGLNAVEVGVEDLGLLAINVDESKCWAGHIVLVSGAEACNQAFGQSGLPRAQISGQEH